MFCTLPAKNPVLIGIAVNRSGKDSTERERSPLDALRPDLMQAYNNVAAPTKAFEKLKAHKTG